jgi:aspartyl-tRNA(Asn)/glutamyl-tRNA(Gln) amidotransferase subunit A
MPEVATAASMRDALASKELSSRELLERSFAAVDSREDEIHAFISLADRERLLDTARKIDDARARGDAVPPYAGLPIAVKDNIAVKGHRLTCGSRILEEYEPPYSAKVVSKLQDAGLLVLGKTNMDEFGFGSSTENSAFFPTRNPRAEDRVPGGTSGGSAAAVAAGFVPWALGTDTGGSVRQPAALCGAAGIRPSYGRVSRYGLVAYASSMDQVGPLATTADDAAALLSIIMGPDSCDGTSLPEPPPSLDQSVSGLRLGIPDEYLSDDCDPAVIRAIDEAAEAAGQLGWNVSRVSLPTTDYALAAYYVIASVEAAGNLARYDGVKYGHRANAGAGGYVEMVTETRTDGFGDEAKRRIMLGTFAASAGYHDQYYIGACRVRTRLVEEFANAFRDVDVLLSPVSPTTAWPIGERVADPMAMYLSDVYSVPAALAGLPAAVIATSLDDAGLPVAVQFTGPRLGDGAVVSAARALEQHLGYTTVNGG